MDEAHFQEEDAVLEINKIESSLGWAKAELSIEKEPITSMRLARKVGCPLDDLLRVFERKPSLRTHFGVVRPLQDEVPPIDPQVIGSAIRLIENLYRGRLAREEYIREEKERRARLH